jgi:DNA-binding FadR family transcriptional regulator
VLAFARGDIAFQRAVVRAARNVGLELVLNSFARLPDELPELTAALYDQREDSLAFYEGCIALMEAGDEQAARATMRSALEALDEAWYRRNAPAELRAAPRRKVAASPPRRASQPGKTAKAAKTAKGKKGGAS